MGVRGRPFVKGDPRIALSAGKQGRKKKPPEWNEMSDDLRLTIVRLMSMKKSELQALLKSDPTGVEMLASKYIYDHAVETVNRFLGKTPDVVKSEVTGKDGKPLVPETNAIKSLTRDELLSLIEATNPKPRETPQAPSQHSTPPA